MTTQGDEHLIAADVFLNDVSTDMVRVELYADGKQGGRAVEKEMTGTRQEGKGPGDYVYRTAVSSSRPATDFTARISAHDNSPTKELGAGWVLWQK